MLGFSDTSHMSDESSSKRTVKINDFKVPAEWHQTVKTAAREDRRKISEEIIHLVYLGLQVRKRMKDSEGLLIDETASDVLTKGPPKQKQKGIG
jgi:hypothetical protein